MTDPKPVPPDYILVLPLENDVPQILASCDKENVDNLKDLKLDGIYIYKRVGGY